MSPVSQALGAPLGQSPKQGQRASASPPAPNERRPQLTADGAVPPWAVGGTAAGPIPASSIRVCQPLAMTAEEENLVRALVHDANVILGSDAPDNVGREGELDGVKEELRLAEKVLNGNATDAEKTSVRELVHPQTRSLFGL
jgi:hypothetical protein